MDPRRKLQVVSAANPSLRVSAAPKQLSIAPAPANNTQLKVATAPQQQIKINVPKAPPVQKYDFASFGKTGEKNKTIFGKNAAWLLPKSLEKWNIMGSTGQFSGSQQDFLSQFDKQDREYQKYYVKNIAERAAKGDQAAVNAYVTLRDSGRFKGGFMDFVEGFNEKLAGGVLRGGLRTTDFLLPGKNTFGLERQADVWDQSDLQYTKAGQYGKTAGTVAKGATDIALLVTGAKAAETAAMKVPQFARIGQVGSNASKLTRAGSYVARQVPGSLAGSSIDVMQTAGRGDEQNVGKSFGIGLVADVAAPKILDKFAAGYRGLKSAFGRSADPTIKYLAKESSPEAIKGILQSGFNVPSENVDDIVSYVAGETNPKAIDKLIQELSIDPNLELTPDVIDQLRNNKIKSVKRDPNAQYEAQYKDGDITARGQAELDKYVYQELGHHIYLNRLTPEEQALFKGTGIASKKSVGRAGYTQSDINSEDFTDYFDKAMRGRIDEVPAEYQAVVRKYANIADEIAATDKVPTGARINTSPQTPTNTTKVPVGNLGGIDAIKATVKTKEGAVAKITEAQAEIDALLQSGDTSADALTKIDNLQKTIDNLQAAQDQLPSEIVVAQQGIESTTVDQAGKELSGVTPQTVDDAVQAADAPLAADTATDAVKVADTVSEAAGERTPRADVPIFGNKIQPETQSGIDELIARSEATPRPEGTVRVFQSNAASGQKTDWVFDNVDSLKSYKNNTTNPGDTFEFMDVPASRLDPTANGEHVFTLKDPESVLNTGNPEAVAKDVAQRGVARSLAQTDTPPQVYENLLGYQSRPNSQTFDMASKAIETDEQGVLQSILGKQQGALTDDETAQALLLLDKAIKNDQLDLAEQIAGKINVSGTENGRAVQILSAIRKTTPEGAYLEAQKIITEAQQKGLLPKDFTIPKETVDTIKSQAEYIQGVKKYADDLEQYIQTVDPNGTEYAWAARELTQANRTYELSVAVLGKTLKDIVPPTVGDKLNSIVNISLLLNPKTFIRNVIGNTANSVAETISGTIATPLDVLASLKTGNRTVKLPNVLKRLTGFGRGLKEGAQETELGVRIGGGGKYDINPAVFKNKVMQRIEKTLGHSLSDMDKAYSTAQFDETLDSLMRANNVTKPTQEMLDIAEQEALYATFQHDSFIARSLMGAKQWLNKAQVKGFGLGDVVVRYPKTPGNLVAVGMDYSPYGFLKGLVQFAKLNEKSGLAAQREAVKNLGRGISGTGLITGGYILAQNNIITARKDSDKDVNSLQRNQGQPPFSFNFSALNRFIRGEDTKPQPGDVIANYDWLQPNAIQLSMGANMALNKDGGNKDWISSTLDQAAMGLETIEEQPILAQTGRFFQTATTPADRGGGIPNAIKDSVVGLPSMFVPSVLNQTAASIDNQARTTYDPNPIKQATNKVVGKLPFASKSLEPVVDSFGNEVKRQQTDNPITRVFNSFVNPAFVTKLKQTPEGQMVLDLYDKTGEKGQFPRVTDRKMQINGESYSLSPKQITEFQKYTGKETERAFADLANNPSFMNLPDDEKVKIMSGIVTDIASAGRIKILGNDPKTVTNDVKAIIGGKTAGFQSKIPEGVNDLAKKYYEKTTFMDQETYDGWLKGEPDQVATDVAGDLNKRLPAGVNTIEAYNGLAKRYAEYEKAKAEAKKDGSWTKLDEKEKEQEFWKGAIKDSRDDLTKDIYDAGSSGAEDYWKQGLIAKEDIEKAIALDDELYRSGLSKSLKFSKKFRRSYGYGVPTAPGESASGGSGGGGGGSKKAKKTGVNELKLRYTPDAAPSVSRVPRNVQLKLNKPAPVQVTPVRIRL